MDPTRIALFDLAEKRLAWTAQRQNVLAANIANANTPGFQARDVQSFEKVLAGTAADGAGADAAGAYGRNRAERLGIFDHRSAEGTSVWTATQSPGRTTDQGR